MVKHLTLVLYLIHFLIPPRTTTLYTKQQL